MQEASQLSEFGKVLLFLIMGIVFLLLAFLAGKWISPDKPNAEKNMSYECGEEPSGNSWLQFNSRFYVISLIFLLFDVELSFIFPWATVFGQESFLNADSRWGWLTLIEMFVFVGILILGLVYVWMKGDLEWIKPVPQIPVTDSPVPLSAYDRINKETYSVRQFSTDLTAKVEIKVPETAAAPKPAFKPVFRKPLQQ